MNAASCPNCSSSYATQVRFTWWGGFLGPKLFNVIKCGACNKQYNGKTGRPNTTAIIIYVGGGAIIVLALLLAFGSV